LFFVRLQTIGGGGGGSQIKGFEVRSRQLSFSRRSCVVSWQLLVGHKKWCKYWCV